MNAERLKICVICVHLCPVEQWGYVGAGGSAFYLHT
jgi:hypothetical protein